MANSNTDLINEQLKRYVAKKIFTSTSTQETGNAKYKQYHYSHLPKYNTMHWHRIHFGNLSYIFDILQRN